MLAHPRRVSLLLMASLLGAAGLTACGNDDADSLPPPADPPATSDQSAEEISLTPEEEQAVEEAKSKFDEFMNAYVELALSGEGSDLERREPVLQHTLEPLASDVNRELLNNWQEERVFTGTLEWSFVDVIQVNLTEQVQEREIPTVWLSYCIDQTAWTLVDSNTDDPIEGPGGRHLSTIQVIKSDPLGSGAAWYVSEREDHRTQSC